MKEYQEPSASPRRSRLWLWIVLGFFILIAALLTGISYMVFSPWQEVPPVYPTAQDMGIQYKLMRRLAKSFDLRKKQIPEKAVIDLTPREINTLFTFADNIQLKNSPYPLRYYRPFFTDKGEFSLVLPIKTDLEKLWGGVIYLKVLFTISKEPQGKIEVRMISCKVTSMPFSVSAAQQLVDQLLAEEQLQKDLKFLNEAIQSISFKDGKLQIQYSPLKLLEKGVRF
jgi:hypothetical protein